MTGTGAESDPRTRELIETDPGILEGIRKSLNQEYVRFMSRMLQEQFGKRGGSIVEHVKKIST